LVNEKVYKNISISGAFLIWGFWTFYINPGSFESRLTSALCQGFLSSIATALVIRSIKVLQKYFKHILVPPLIMTSVTSSTAVLIHYMIGTAKIFATLAPALFIALIFSIITSYNLSRNTVRE